MTDIGLVLKRLTLIEACLADLRALEDPARILDDVRTERFVEHTLQIAIQATLDVAAHIVADERLGEPRSNRELFEILARNAWFSPPQRDALARMVGFRNILVHGYAEVDPSVVRDVVERHLSELDRFVSDVKRRVGDA